MKSKCTEISLNNTQRLKARIKTVSEDPDSCEFRNIDDIVA